jgi:AcrR family transcriptional regulator
VYNVTSYLQEGVLPMRELNSVEEKILDRALYLMGKNRTSDISIRAIAKEANVNVSAINYYFRTKEEMLNQVKEFFITNTLSVSSIMDNAEYDEEERLVLSANEIMEYIIRFPGITVLLREAAMQKGQDEISDKILKVNNEMTEKIEKLLKSVTKSDETLFQYKNMIFMSSITHPVDNGDVLYFGETIANNREERINYIRHLVNILKAN